MPRPRAYSIDLRHLLDEHGEPCTPAVAAMGRYVALVVEVGSVTPVGSAGPAALLCANPARRKRCGAGLWVARRSHEVIEWECPGCGEQGQVHGWRGGPFDLERVGGPRLPEEGPCGAVRLEELDAVRRLGEGSAGARRVLAEAADVGEGYFVMFAGYRELEALHELAATAAELARGRDRRLLDRFSAAVDALRTTMPEFAAASERQEPIDLEAVRAAGTPAEVIAIAREIAANVGRESVELEDLVAAEDAWRAGRRSVLH